MFAKSQISRVAIAVAMSVGMATSAMAQETTSSISGYIIGPQGAPAAGTVVTIKHIPSGSTKTVTVNANGEFDVSGLRVGGPYQIVMDSNSLNDAVVDDVYLSLGDTLNFDYALTSGEESVEKIQVTGTRLAAMNFGQSGPAANFGLQTIENAPAINRNITDIIRIDPRIYVNEGAGDLNQVQCVGKSPRFNSLTLDGVRMNDSFGLNSNGYPTERMPFSYSAIEQVAVEIAPFSVIYGGFTACNINAVTKSGTNEIRGGVFYDYTSDSMRGDSLEGEELTLGEYDEKRYGFDIGGAIIEDSLFFYAAYEKLEGVNLFDRGVQGSGAINELPITQAQLDEIVRISNELYQYDPGPVPTSLPVEDEKLLVKIDWNINDDHRASFTYNYNDGYNNNESDGDLDEFEFQNHLYERGAELNSYVGAVYSDWTDNFSTEVRLSYLELDNRQISLGSSNGQVGGNDFGEMRIVLDGVDVYLGTDDSRQANDLNYDVLGLILRGNYYFDNGHKLTFGYEREDLDVFNVFVQHTETEMRFYGGISAFEAGTPGAIYYNNAPSGDPNDAAAVWGYASNSLYIQDEFDLTEDLSITAGVRYDWYTTSDAPQENPDFVADYGFSNSTNLDGEALIQPLIGLTYTLTDSTELRGGIGRFSGGNPNVWLSNNFSNNNILQFGARGRSFGYTDGSRSLFDDDVVYKGVEDGVPAGPGYGIPGELYDAVAAGEGSNFEINYLDPDFKIPSEIKLSAGVTHITDGGYVVTADLLMSLTQDAAMIKRGDLERVGTTEDGYAEYESPKIDSLVLTNSDEDSLSYTLSFGANKSWDNGVSISAGYAYNDAEDVQPMTSAVAFSNYNYRAFTNPNEEVSSTSDWNIKHRFTSSLRYEKEIFGGLNTTFAMVALANSGRPYSLVYDQDTGNSIFGFTPYLDSDSVLPPGYERNGEETPWWFKVDVSVRQELPAFSADHSASVFFTIDNFTNFLKDDWGILEGIPFNTVEAGTESPEVRFGDASLWEARIGVKYQF